MKRSQRKSTSKQSGNVHANKSFVTVLFLLKRIARRVVTASIGGFLSAALAAVASLAQTPHNTPETISTPPSQPSPMPDQLWESSYTGGEGRITGRIVQGTAGAAAPINQEVTLMAYTNLMPVSVFTTTIDASGRFTFEQAATSPDVAYYVGATYADVAYGSELFTLSAATPTMELTIPVYETTTEIDQLRFNRVQWMIDHLPGTLRVRELLTVANNQDRTVIGEALEGSDRTVTVALPIPAEAIDLEFQDGALGARYVNVDGVIYDTTPIRPGAQDRQVALAYSIPYSETGATIVADIAYPVDTFGVLVADLPSLAVEVSAPLENVGNQTVQHVAYRVWNGALAEPTQLSITLQNLIPARGVDPRLAQAQSTPTPIRSVDAPSSTIPPVFAGIAVAALVLVIGGGILYWKYSRNAVQTLYALRREKERLLTEIATLDNRHDQGDIDDETWSTERVSLMNSLREVSDTLEQMPQSRRRG